MAAAFEDRCTAMGPVPNELERLQEQLGELLAELALGDEQATAGEDALKLVGAFGQLFEVMTRLETDRIRMAAAPATDQAQTASELGEFAAGLLDKAARLLPAQDPARSEQLALLRIGFTHWVLRQGGAILQLEPVVDDLAMLANRSDAPAMLADLGRVMLDLIDRATPEQRQDLEAGNPGRPWRLLHLNLGIVATRARRPDLMEHAFKRLVQHLPQDAPQFFHQGMQQLQRGDYPESVRSIMSDYFQHWAGKPALH